ncbi:adenosylmethionine decarboxylase, partial [Candidatus Babeliales bacterium]|nr:adenosylmethionine decarboxylase [Candidatus Babeliales bacterium]
MKKRFAFIIPLVLFAFSIALADPSTPRLIKQAPPSHPVGTHLTAEFWETQKNIDSAKELERILIEAGKRSGSTPLKVAIEKFDPQGITGVIILAESHISVHTWPEENYVAVDAFTCGEHTVPQKAIEYLQKQFKPQMVQIQEIKRGIKANAKPVPVEQAPKPKERRDTTE